MKRVLITGASGFVGSNLARHLIGLGHEVYLFVKPTSDTWRIDTIKGHTHYRYAIDLKDKGMVDFIRKIKPQWIFHLAAHGGYSWETDSTEMVESNLLATINLVEACLSTGFEAFVNTGSSSEYGFKDCASKENDFLEPNSVYAVTKAASTMYCDYIAKKYDRNIKTLRLYSVYGPYENKDRLVPQLILRGMKNKYPRSLVNPGVSRDFIYIDDVVKAYLLAAQSEKVGIYNVGTGVSIRMEEAVWAAEMVIGIDTCDSPKWGSMPDRDWDTDIWVANNRKIRTELGWRPEYSFEEGLKKTLEWFKNNNEIVESYYEVPIRKL